METKVSVPYEHHSADLSPIYLAVTSTTVRTAPSSQAWHAAYRDTIDGKRVVWSRFPSSGRMVNVWLKDKNGERKVAVAQC